MSEHIATARFQGHIGNMSIVCAYAPTETASEEDKDEFYDRLESVCNTQSKNDIFLLIGGLNAKIGAENTDLEHIMGRQGLEGRNDNGERLIDFCWAHELIIGGSLFPHKTVHKATWRSADNLTENQFDHICQSRK